MLYSKHLAFYYGDAIKLKNNISYTLSRYEAIGNKTEKVIKRINDYKNLLNWNRNF